MGLYERVCREMVQTPGSWPDLYDKATTLGLTSSDFQHCYLRKCILCFGTGCSIIITWRSRGCLLTQPPGTGLRGWVFVEAENALLHFCVPAEFFFFIQWASSPKIFAENGSICCQWDRTTVWPVSCWLATFPGQAYGNWGLWMFRHCFGFSPEACEAESVEIPSVNHGLVKCCLKHLSA